MAKRDEMLDIHEGKGWSRNPKRIPPPPDGYEHEHPKGPYTAKQEREDIETVEAAERAANYDPFEGYGRHGRSPGTHWNQKRR